MGEYLPMALGSLNSATWCITLWYLAYIVSGIIDDRYKRQLVEARKIERNFCSGAFIYLWLDCVNSAETFSLIGDIRSNQPNLYTNYKPYQPLNWGFYLTVARYAVTH